MGGIQRLLHDPVFFRLGLTLIHFLWQGLAIALVAAALRGLLRRTRPAVRYLVFVCLLTSMAAAPALTFHLWTHAPPPSAMTWQSMKRLLGTAAGQRESRSLGVTTRSAGQQAIPAQPRRLAVPEWAKRVWRRLHQGLPVAGGLWALGVIVLSMQLLVQWTYFARAARGAPLVTGEWWRSRVNSFSIFVPS